MLVDEIEKWKDDFGLVTDKPKNFKGYAAPSGNGLLNTALYCLLSYRLNGKEIEKISTEFSRAVAICSLEAGLLQRSPAKVGDQEGWDDYVLVCLGAKQLNPKIAFDIAQYGMTPRERFKWVYNNVKPGKFSFQTWFGRSPAFPAHVLWCAGFNPNLFQRLGLAAAIFFSAFFSMEKTDQIIQTWAMIEACADMCFPVALASAFFNWRLAKHWGDAPMKRVMKTYYPEEHPVAKYWV